MSDYRLIFYFRRFSRDNAALRRCFGEIGLEVELREIVLSRKNREALKKATGKIDVPCLVIGSTNILGAEEIKKYLCLRYGYGEKRKVKKLG